MEKLHTFERAVVDGVAYFTCAEGDFYDMQAADLAAVRDSGEPVNFTATAYCVLGGDGRVLAASRDVGRLTPQGDLWGGEIPDEVIQAPWDYSWSGSAFVPFVPPIEQRRANAVLSRVEFCIALKRAGILTAESAKQAARGDWPVEFTAALAGVTDADEAEILWAGCSTIERNHPLIASLATAAGLDDTALDALFGL